MKRPSNELIDKVLANVATKKEARDVAEWFTTPEGNEYLSKCIEENLQTTMIGNEEFLIDHDIPTLKLYNEIEKHIQNRKKKRFFFRIAAIIIPFILIFSLFFTLNTRVDLLGNSEYEDIYVPKGKKIQILFQDGSKVYLNSDSRIRYPRKFAFTERKVFLEGQAYFIVSKQRYRPFIINLDGADIKVLGTSFDIKSYSNSDFIILHLDEGKINFISNDEKQYALNPKEKLVYNKKQKKIFISKTMNSSTHSAWKNNTIAFKDAPLSHVIGTLERWYDVKFVSKDSITKDCLFTLTSENQKIETVLKTLETISPLKFDIKNDTIEISKK